MKILVAVDGSPHSLRTGAGLADRIAWFSVPPAITLLHAHLPIPYKAAAAWADGRGPGPPARPDRRAAGARELWGLLRRVLFEIPPPRPEKRESRKHWIAYTVCTSGRLVVDNGARDALMQKGKSLLPGGIVKVEGMFKIGDCVSCADLAGNVFARGLAKYSSADLDRIKGLKTSQIASVLGRKDYDEVIHRDDMVIL